VAAFADLALLVESFDLEADHAAFDHDHLGRGSNGGADRGRGEMADIDLIIIGVANTIGMPASKCPTVRSGGTTRVRSALMPILM